MAGKHTARSVIAVCLAPHTLRRIGKLFSTLLNEFLSATVVALLVQI